MVNAIFNVIVLIVIKSSNICEILYRQKLYNYYVIIILYLKEKTC